MTRKEKANEIQEELKDVTKQHYTTTETHYTTTKTHYKVIWVLTAICALSAIATFYCNYFLSKTGRYAISGGKGGVYVLDTKTSQLWQRTTSGNMYLGTNEKPMAEIISGREKVKTFEEIEPSKNNK